MMLPPLPTNWTLPLGWAAISPRSTVRGSSGGPSEGREFSRDFPFGLSLNGPHDAARSFSASWWLLCWLVRSPPGCMHDSDDGPEVVPSNGT